MFEMTICYNGCMLDNFLMSLYVIFYIPHNEIILFLLLIILRLCTPLNNTCIGTTITTNLAGYCMYETFVIALSFGL